jgi:hypothetical protein
MGFFDKKGSYMHAAPPVVSREPSKQPTAGGARTRYRVEGVWAEDGVLLRPDLIVITLSEGRETRHAGDIIELDRQEATVVAKRHAITPIVDAPLEA